MPPRHHYWTIILEGKPTAFRAHTQDELVPTLRQLQARHPDAVMKWFARGRLWESQDVERAESAARRRPPSGDRPPGGDRRGREWRPGGEHKDPRDRFKIPRDEKRRRFAENLFRDRSDAPPETPDSEGADRSRPPQRPAFDGPPRGDRGGKPPWNPAANRERRPWNPDGPRGPKPSSDRRGERGGKPPWKGGSERGEKPAWKRDSEHGEKPAWKPDG